MPDRVEPSEALVELIFQALEHSLNSIDDGAGPLIPFVLGEKSGKRELQRCVAADLETGLAQARKAAQKAVAKGAMAAAAYDGFVTLDGTRSDAIFVQAAESSDGPTHLFCGRYSSSPNGKVRALGSPVYLQQDAELFTSPDGTA